MPADTRGILRVAVPVAPLNAEPRAGSEQISQRLFGHAVELLERQEPWLRVRGADGYAGWMHAGYLREPAPGEPEADRLSLGCTVREDDGRRLTIPLGGLLAAGALVETGEALPRAAIASHFPPDADRIPLTAVERFEGTAYAWGGITPWGADCSGLVQSVFGLHGIPLPRDARDQALHGERVHQAGEPWSVLRPADLLFFSDREDGRITHVAVSLGGSRLVHLALGRGGYAVEDLERGQDPYVAGLVGRYRFARRVVGG